MMTKRQLISRLNELEQLAVTLASPEYGAICQADLDHMLRSQKEAALRLRRELHALVGDLASRGCGNWLFASAACSLAFIAAEAHAAEFVSCGQLAIRSAVPSPLHSQLDTLPVLFDVTLDRVAWGDGRALVLHFSVPMHQVLSDPSLETLRSGSRVCARGMQRSPLAWELVPGLRGAPLERNGGPQP